MGGVTEEKYLARLSAALPPTGSTTVAPRPSDRLDTAKDLAPSLPATVSCFPGRWPDGRLGPYDAEQGEARFPGRPSLYLTARAAPGAAADATTRIPSPLLRRCSGGSPPDSRSGRSGRKEGHFRSARYLA